MTYDIDTLVCDLEEWVKNQIITGNGGTLLSWDDASKTICLRKHDDGIVPSYGHYLEFVAPNNKIRYGLACVEKASYSIDGLWMIHLQSPIRILVPAVAIGDLIIVHTFSDKFLRLSKTLGTIVFRKTNKEHIG